MNANEEAAFWKWWEFYRAWTWHQHVTSLGDATEPMPDSWKRQSEHDVLLGWIARATHTGGAVAQDLARSAYQDGYGAQPTEGDYSERTLELIKRLSVNQTSG